MSAVSYVHPSTPSTAVKNPFALVMLCKLSFALGVLRPHWLDDLVGLALLASPPSRELSRAASSLTEARTPLTSTWTWRGRPAGMCSAKSSRRRRYGICHHDANIRVSHLYDMYVRTNSGDRA